tara:strand:- start:318 stop:509 length:192 start_codon:yes stop_codon:yes gene_type:complete
LINKNRAKVEIKGSAFLLALSTRIAAPLPSETMVMPKVDGLNHCSYILAYPFYYGEYVKGLNG